jgi:hypothetical protein
MPTIFFSVWMKPTQVSKDIMQVSRSSLLIKILVFTVVYLRRILILGCAYWSESWRKACG